VLTSRAHLGCLLNNPLIGRVSVHVDDSAAHWHSTCLMMRGLSILNATHSLALTVRPSLQGSDLSTVVALQPSGCAR